MRSLSFFLLAAVAVSLAACSGGNSGSSTQTSATTTTAPAAANTTDFPLYDGSTVIGTKNFTQNVDTSQMKTGSAVFAQGSGTYAGQQVIAKSGATLDQLAKWLSDETAKPPNGYTAVVVSGSGMDRAHAMAKQYGIDFAAFQKTENGSKHDVILVAMDPALLDKRVGPAIVLLHRYATLPDMLRGPIDTQLKQRVGMSGSELLDPGSPIGAALSAYDDVKSSNQRALILVDAAKQ
jgi:hypothetical protein